MTNAQLLGILVLTCGAAGMAAANQHSASTGPLRVALTRLQAERARLEALEQAAGKRPSRRAIWYLDRLSTGLDAARDMVRRMVAPLPAGERAAAEPLPPAAHLLSIADVLRHEADSGKSCSATAMAGPLAGRRIVVDAGHGGKDQGATGICRRAGVEQFRLQEKDLTLDVAQRVADKLRQAGATVYMTRTSDETLDLYGRGIAGRVLEADAFVSIHFNYSVLSDPTPRGGRAVDGIDYTAIYVYSPSRRNLPMPGYSQQLEDRIRLDQPALSNRLAGHLFDRVSAAMGTSDAPPDAVRARMRAETARRARLARSRSKRTAAPEPSEESGSSEAPRAVDAPSAAQQRLHDRFYSRYPQSALPRGVRRSDFVVLRETHDKPSVLVETCFLGDSRQLTRLREPDRRDSVATALCQGLADYFRR
ncbi:MAG: N-acetylmuramoyl-L-alanine amidase [Candidatus Wallbacteria bacterium]|nr:N-acetylmuramoyl-L-alanine amidase [Candidatus Wallbacteria bacterium]